MAIQHTPNRGIPYPDSNEPVDDAKHWHAAMSVVDTELHNVRHNATAEVENRVDARAQETVPPLVRYEVRTNVANQVDERINQQVPDLVNVEVANAIAEDDTVVQAASTAVDGALSDADLMRSEVARQEFVAQDDYPSVAVRTAGPFISDGTTGAADLGVPRVVSETVLIEDSDRRLVDGAKFFSPLRVANYPGQWLDTWYGYVSGHDSRAIWLVTAPSILGPWTWREPVIGVPESGALVEDSRFQHHTASPDAQFIDGQIHLYYHGPLADNMLEQPTALGVSSDGVNFTLRGVVIPTEYTNHGSPYRTSTSYARIAKHGRLYHAIWQGTTGRNSVVDHYSYAPMPVGHASSLDGVSWVKRQPILTSFSKDQGLMAPGFTRFYGGWLVVGTYRAFDGVAGQRLEVRSYYGTELDDLYFLGAVELPGANRRQELQGASFVFENGRMFIVGGTTGPNGGSPRISACEIDWS